MISRTINTALIFFLLTLSAIPLFAQVTTTDYLVSWLPNPEPDVTEYVIYRSLYRDTLFTVIDSVDASTFSYMDEDVPKGTRYFYRLIAKNGSGERSPFSNFVSGLTIEQDADEVIKDLCRITTIDRSQDGSYDINWSTVLQTVGFIQYDDDATLDSMSTWDNDQYSDTHTNQLLELVGPRTYYLRAVSYDDDDNMIVSALDTLVLTGDNPSPLSAPLLSIYPVPYHPGMGILHFNNLPAGGSITVINGSGLQVWQKEIGDDTSHVWDGTNTQGSPVMSGVYYVVVKNSGGAVIEKRPIMIVQ